MEPCSVDMDEQLYNYIENGRLHGKGIQPCIGFCAGKVVVAGYAVQGSIISGPDNRLIVCCPQARHASRKMPPISFLALALPRNQHRSRGESGSELGGSGRMQGQRAVSHMVACWVECLCVCSGRGGVLLEV